VLGESPLRYEPPAGAAKMQSSVLDHPKGSLGMEMGLDHLARWSAAAAAAAPLSSLLPSSSACQKSCLP